MVFGCSSLASDYGATGLIDIPTARLADDANLRITAAFDEVHQQYALTYGVAPWLEATFRYTGFDNFFYWDRNYEIKALLRDETVHLPAFAIGIRDAVGAGVFGSEYLVASKKIGPIDLTAGVAWGRLAGSGNLLNPLIKLDPQFGTRNADTGPGGQVAIRNFFSGPQVGFFGGMTLDIPRLPLRLIAEVNPDKYEFNASYSESVADSPLSFGLEWDVADDLKLSLSSQHLKHLGLSFEKTIDTSFDRSGQAKNKKFISSYFLQKQDLPSQLNVNKWYDKLLYDVERAGLWLVEGEISEDGSTARLVIGNAHYQLWVDAIDKHLALADLHLPPSVTRIYLVVENKGHRNITLLLDRPSAMREETSFKSLSNARILEGRTLDAPQYRTSFSTGKINNSVTIKPRFQLFDPDDPARYQIYAEVNSTYVINNYWQMRSSLAVDIDNNFSESTRSSDSTLPRVRSNSIEYLRQGDSGISQLFLEGRNSFNGVLHYRGFAGILEDMYGGAGGEVLYWPVKSRIALGVSASYVKQRAFNRRLTFFDYQTVTGHLSAYWATPYYNYDLGLHVGKYLAGDKGATVEVRRTFRNGWQVGVWSTFTDVSFSEFGEGSFDKGFFFKIPLESVSGSAASAIATRVRPIQRDGGQRLEDFSGNIFWDLRDTRYDAFKVGRVRTQ